MKSKRYFLLSFLLVASLFFIWGFCLAMLDVLNKHFQDVLHVSKTQSGFIQTSVFGAYFIVALPAALLIRRIGYQRGILFGLAMVALGAFMFVPAGLLFKTFGAFLLALSILSSGLTCLETAANPYITMLGPKDGAAGRLSIAQAFNSVAYVIAPTVGGAFIYGRHQNSGTVANFSSLLTPYIVLGCLVLVVFAVFSLLKLPAIDGQDETDSRNTSLPQVPLFTQPHFIWGTLTQFFYIAAQVGVNAFAINYILENAITCNASGTMVADSLFSQCGAITGAANSEVTAAYIVSFAMILYACGRFAGAVLVRLIKANLLLAFCGIANSIIMLLIIADIKNLSWRVLPFCWLFMSIMFPFIFAMSLRNLGGRTKLAASFQIMSIVGGAIAPPVMGWMADKSHGMGLCFIVPLIGFIAPALYGTAYPRLLKKSGENMRVNEPLL